MLRTLSLTWALAGCTGTPLAQPDLAPPPDLQRPNDDLGGTQPPRADPWLSSGGGSATASGRQLNLTVGGTAGSATAPNGAVITFGPFSTQTY